MNTYAVATDGSNAKQVGGTVALAAKAEQLEFTNNNRFLYTVGNDPSTGVNAAVYAMNSDGAPQLPAVQTTSFPAGTGFLVHPSRNFAYEMQPGPSDILSIQSTLYLQPVDPSTGTFGNNPQQLDKFGPAYTSESLKRFNGDGTALFDEIDGSGPHGSGEIAFRKSAIDPTTGKMTLGNIFWLYSYYGGIDVSTSTSLGDHLVAFARIGGYPDDVSMIDISPVTDTDIGSNSPQVLVHCTSDMIAACATTTNVQLDPAEQFVFATDQSTSKIRIFRIDVPNHKLVDTGSSIPSGPIAFSSDGSLVYAAAKSGTAVQVYRFDHSTGALAAGALINVGTQFGMYPLQ